MTAPKSYYRPGNLENVVALLQSHPDLTILAGGTDVYPARTARAAWGGLHHDPILDITRLDELRGIEDRGSHWWIGALTTWTDIVRADLPPLFDGLKAAAREIGAIQIQNRGTIGGNCCTASPAGDSIPCLLAIDAEFELASHTPRRVHAREFFTGYRKTALAPGEILTGIRVPKDSAGSAFLKLGARRYLVISIVMAAGVFEADDTGIVHTAKIAVGACSPVAQRLPRLEARLVGQHIDTIRVEPEDLAHLTPLDDIRADAEYRRAAALQLTRDLIADLAAPTTRERAHG